MAIGSGLGSSVGMAPEVTYGTYVAPTRFIEGTAQMRKRKAVYQGGGMAAGRLVQPGGRRYVTSRGAGGTLSTSVYSRGMGHLLAGVMGGSAAPVQQGASAAYLQTHALGDPAGKSYTIQAGVPTTDGTVNPYTFLGCQISAVEFSCEINGALTASWEFEARDVDEDPTIAAPSYPAVDEFHFAQAAVLLGPYGAEEPVDGVRRLTVRIGRPKHDGGPYMGSGGLRSAGVLNAWSTVSGSFEVDFLDKSTFADRYRDDTPASLVWEFVGPNIASTYDQTFRIRVPMLFMDGDTPTADSPEVVRTTFPFTAQWDGTRAASTIEYMSADTTL